MADTNICPNCGSPYSLDKAGNLVCRFCGYVKPKAPTSEEESLLYAAAQALRLASFEEAEQMYQDIVERFKKCAEAYWGLTLCQYGIKFEDDYDGKKIPTCYATQYESFLENPNYKKALSYASEEQKAFFENTALRIEKTRKEWIEKAEKEPPYDIFLSYKDTEDGKRTDDSYDAHELYNTLTGLGYRVFFSRVTLAGKTGENYEPYIFSALNSAPVMLVFASKPEYVTSTWVKNEWNRYLSRIRNGHKQEGSLAVIFRNFSPSALPRALSGLQNLKYGEITFLSNLKSYVDKYIEAAKASSFQIKRKEVAIAKKQGKKSLEAVKAESITSLSQKKRSSGTLNVERRQIGGSNVGRLSANEESKLAQAEIYLSRKDFKHAGSLYEEVLEKSPKNAEALLGKMLCDSKTPGLMTWVENHWEKEDEIKEMLDAATHASEETANKILQGFADAAENLASEDLYQDSLTVFHYIAEYDSKATNELPDKLLEWCLKGYKKREDIPSGCIDLVIEALKYLAEKRHGSVKILAADAIKKQDYEGARKLFDFYLDYGEIDANDYLCLLQAKGGFPSENDLLSHVGETGDFSCFTNDLPLHSEEIDDLFDILSSWTIKYIKLYPSSAPKYIPFLAAYRFPKRDEMVQKAIELACKEPSEKTAELLEGVLNSFGDDSFDQFSAAILRFSEAAVEKGKAPLAERFLSKLIEYDPDNGSLYEKRILAHLCYRPFSDLSALGNVIWRLDDFKDIESLIALRGKKKVGEVLALYLDACLKSKDEFEKTIKVFDTLCAYLPEDESATLRSYLEKMAPICKEKGLFEYAEKYYSTLVSLDPMGHQNYWGLLQSKLRCKDDDGLIACDTPLGEYDEFENAKLAASGDKEALAHYIDIELKQSEAIKERQGKALAKKKKKRRHIFFGVVLGLFLAAAAAMTALTFTTFVPQGKVSSASASIRNGNYQEAINTLSDLSYGESKNLLNMAYAGSFFSKNDYEQGIDYVTKAGGETTVHYDAKGGSTDKTEEVIRPKKKNIDNEAFKLGYDAAWKQTKFQLDIDNEYSASLWLEATYTIKTYTISYELAGGTNSKENPTTYTVEDTIALKAATREGYTFTGWVDGAGSKIESINAGTTGNLFLTATWNDGDQYLLTLDPDGGEVESSTVSVQYDKEYALPTPTKKGYEFLGWHLENSTDIFPAEGTWRWTKVSKLVASWSICTYTITYEGISDIPSSWPTTYNVNDEVTLPEATLQGHTFQGWTNEKGETVTKIEKGSVGHCVFYANWEKYTITILVDAGSLNKGTVKVEINGVVEGESVENFDKQISWDAAVTLTALPAEGYIFKGWYEDKTSALVSKNSSYTFVMPSSNYCLVAHFWTQEERDAVWKPAHGVEPVFSNDGKTVTYGLYPQTHVNDSKVIEALNSLDATVIGQNGWYLYEDEYYAKLTARPYESIYKFDDNTSIVTGSVYWFKCEPIKWNVLQESEGRYYLLSDVLLDAHRYHSVTTPIIVGDNVRIYPNNYKNSDIRSWLNGDFYDSAFALGNSYVMTDQVENAPGTTNAVDNPYACENTSDKVFLPSYEEYLSNSLGFPISTGSTVTRNCKTSDWTRARNAFASTYSTSFYNGNYWTRSPNSSSYTTAWAVRYDGTVFSHHVAYEELCVRPAIIMSAKFDLTVTSEDESKGTVAVTSGSGLSGETITVKATPANGYLFKGWYDGETKVSDETTFTFAMPPRDYHLVAKWTPVQYTISYTLNGGADSTPNPTSYTIEDSFDFSAPTKAGYSFQGWYDGETKYTDIAQGTTGDLSLEARWSAVLNALSVTSEDNEKGTVSVTSGSGYTDETITVAATPANGYALKGWYNGETRVSTEATYVFTMPPFGLSLTARFCTEEQKTWDLTHGAIPTLSGNTITYGLYPQTHVNNPELISALNALGSSSINQNGWYLYEGDYYAKTIAETRVNCQFDDGTNISTGTTYWFKCEPIAWKVLNISEDRYSVLSDVLLEVGLYHGSLATRTIGGETIYPNNFEHSDIRTWLNGDFYNAAFSMDNSCIQDTVVDNDAGPNNPYSCDDTIDKVSLLSSQDYAIDDYGFSTPSTRRCKTTDWTRARYAYSESNYGEYWVRSPLPMDSNGVYHINCNGTLTWGPDYPVNHPGFCVRPALTLCLR